MNFVVLYRGDSVANARLVAASADPDLVSAVAGALLEHGEPESDPVLRAIDRGRMQALWKVATETDAEDQREEDR